MDTEILIMVALGTGPPEGGTPTLSEHGHSNRWCTGFSRSSNPGSV
jgi:hypothetical protein